MAFDIGTIEGRVKLVYDSKGLTSLDKDLNKVDKSMQQTEKRSSRLGSSLKSGLKVGAAAAGTALAGGLAYGLKQSIVEAREAGKVTRQTEAVIRSTGGAANVTAKELGDLSQAISNKTAIDDEQIQSAGNLLLTFKDIRNEAGKGNDIFNQTTKAVVDLSVAMGQDTKSSAIQLGKALNDPISGLSALRRVGIQFTEQQQLQIEKLTESGNKMKAQKLILQELTSQFGGSAAAQADPLQRLQVVFNNFLETVGVKLLPIINTAANALSKFIVQFTEGKGKGGEFKDTLADLWEVIKSLVPTIKIGGQVILSLLKGFAELPGPVKAAIGGLLAFALIAPKIALMINVFMGMKTAAMGLFAVLKAAPILMGPIGIAIAALAAGAFLIIKNWDKVKKFLASTWNWMKSAFSNLASTVSSLARKGFLGPIPWILSNWKKVLNFMKGLPGKIGSAISSIGRIILSPFSWAANAIKSVLNSIVGAFRGAINRIKAIAGGVGGAVGNVVDAINPFAEGGKVGPSAGGPQIALIGEGKKDEWVISQEGPRSKNIGYLAEAAKALGVPGFAKGGRLDQRISNRRTLIDQKKREFSISGGIITDSEYARLLALYETQSSSNPGLLALLRMAIKQAPKGQRKKDAQFALRDAQLERDELRAERRGARSELRENKMERILDALASTPFDDMIAQLETDLSLANAGYGGNPKEITGKLTKELEQRLALLRRRLSATKDREQIKILQQAIQGTVSDLSGLKDSGSSGPSIVEQVATAANMRYGLMAGMGGNAMAFGLGQGGQKLASANGTNVYLSGEFKLDGKDPHQSVRALSSQLANNIA